MPAQTNDYDCGLFVMAFVEHFVGAVPPTLNVAAVRASLAGGSAFPGFLTSEWFLPAAASNLVWDLRKMVLIRMGVSARAPKHTHASCFQAPLIAHWFLAGVACRCTEGCSTTAGKSCTATAPPVSERRWRGTWWQSCRRCRRRGAEAPLEWI